MNYSKYGLVFASMLIAFCFFTSCNSTEPDSPICFTVSGDNVTIENFWDSGSSTNFEIHGNTSGTAWTNITSERDGETHETRFTNVTSTSLGDLISFNATIDGTSYSYPEDRCD